VVETVNVAPTSTPPSITARGFPELKVPAGPVQYALVVKDVDKAVTYGLPTGPSNVTGQRLNSKCEREKKLTSTMQELNAFNTGHHRCFLHCDSVSGNKIRLRSERDCEGLVRNRGNAVGLKNTDTDALYLAPWKNRWKAREAGIVRRGAYTNASGCLCGF
jgi:hypothetical protein